MIHAYINVPNPHLTIHCDPTCGFVQDMQPPRRLLSIDPTNLATVLTDLDEGAVTFAAAAGLNGLWLRIELDNAEHEAEAARRVKSVLASHHTGLRDAPISIHCEQ